MTTTATTTPPRSPTVRPPGPPLRAVLVSYSFPPVGGAGVQRVLKLAKHLPAHGVRPTVLTVENPSVPLRDESLAEDLPRDVEVLRARTLEPGYAVKQAAWNASAAKAPGLRQVLTRRLSGLARQLLFPDPQLLWQPQAGLTLLQRLSAQREDVVLISGPPFSQYLLAPLMRLVRKADRPAVVLDYRDEWSTLRKSYEMNSSRVAELLGEPLEAALLRCADAVTTATEAFRQNLLCRFPFLQPERVRAIPNGYDPEDFPGDLPGRLPALPRDRLVVTYAGTVFRLTSARGLLSAVRRLHRDEPRLAQRLRVRFIGRIVDTELDAFEGMEAFGVERLGYLPHTTVLRELAASHITTCILDDVEGADRIYPAKAFELMYLRRPCLVLAPPGALADLARRHQLGSLVHPRDEESIFAYLLGKLRAQERGALEEQAHSVDIERYDRRALAGEFAEVLRIAAEAKGR